MRYGFALLLLLATLLAVLPVRALNTCSAGAVSSDREERDFLILINDYRAANGVAPLDRSGILYGTAAWMANDLGSNNYFSHTDSLGRSPYARTVECGYPGGAGENLAGGYETAQQVFEAWRSSPGHNANMLNPIYTEIGVAREFVPGSTYGWYWATDFGLAHTRPPMTVWAILPMVMRTEQKPQ